VGLAGGRLALIPPFLFCNLLLAAAEHQEGAGQQSESVSTRSQVYFRDLKAIAGGAKGKPGNSKEK